MEDGREQTEEELNEALRLRYQRMSLVKDPKITVKDNMGIIVVSIVLISLLLFIAVFALVAHYTSGDHEMKEILHRQNHNATHSNINQTSEDAIKQASDVNLKNRTNGKIDCSKTTDDNRTEEMDNVGTANSKDKSSEYESKIKDTIMNETNQSNYFEYPTNDSRAQDMDNSGTAKSKDKTSEYDSKIKDTIINETNHSHNFDYETFTTNDTISEENIMNRTNSADISTEGNLNIFSEVLANGTFSTNETNISKLNDELIIYNETETSNDTLNDSSSANKTSALSGIEGNENTNDTNITTSTASRTEVITEDIYSADITTTSFIQEQWTSEDIYQYWDSPFLPQTILPVHYDLFLDISVTSTSGWCYDAGMYTGNVTITVVINIATDFIVIHANDLRLNGDRILIKQNNENMQEYVEDVHYNYDYEYYVIKMSDYLQEGEYQITIVEFMGCITETSDGLVLSSYTTASRDTR